MSRRGGGVLHPVQERGGEKKNTGGGDTSYSKKRGYKREKKLGPEPRKKRIDHMEQQKSSRWSEL